MGKRVVRSFWIHAEQKQIVIMTAGRLWFSREEEHRIAFDDLTGLALEAVDSKGEVHLTLELTRKGNEPLMLWLEVDDLDRLDEARDLFTRLAAPLTFKENEASYRSAPEGWYGFREDAAVNRLSLRLTRERGADVIPLSAPDTKANYGARSSTYQKPALSPWRAFLLWCFSAVMLGVAVIGGIYVLVFGRLVWSQPASLPDTAVEQKVEFSKGKELQFTVYASSYSTYECTELSTKLELMTDDPASGQDPFYTLTSPALISSEDDQGGCYGGCVASLTRRVLRKDLKHIRFQWTLLPHGCKADINGLELQIREPRWEGWKPLGSRPSKITSMDLPSEAGQRIRVPLDAHTMTLVTSCRADDFGLCEAVAKGAQALAGQNVGVVIMEPLPKSRRLLMASPMSRALKKYGVPIVRGSEQLQEWLKIQPSGAVLLHWNGDILWRKASGVQAAALLAEVSRQAKIAGYPPMLLWDIILVVIAVAFGSLAAFVVFRRFRRRFSRLMVKLDEPFSLHNVARARSTHVGVVLRMTYTGSHPFDSETWPADHGVAVHLHCMVDGVLVHDKQHILRQRFGVHVGASSTIRDNLITLDTQPGQYLAIEGTVSVRESTHVQALEVFLA